MSYSKRLMTAADWLHQKLPFGFRESNALRDADYPVDNAAVFRAISQAADQLAGEVKREQPSQMNARLADLMALSIYSHQGSTTTPGREQDLFLDRVVALCRTIKTTNYAGTHADKARGRAASRRHHDGEPR